jgi:hypothetical protein
MTRDDLIQAQQSLKSDPLLEYARCNIVLSRLEEPAGAQQDWGVRFLDRDSLTLDTIHTPNISVAVFASNPLLASSIRHDLTRPVKQPSSQADSSATVEQSFNVVLGVNNCAVETIDELQAALIRCTRDAASDATALTLDVANVKMVSFTLRLEREKLTDAWGISLTEHMCIHPLSPKAGTPFWRAIVTASESSELGRLLVKGVVTGSIRTATDKKWNVDDDESSIPVKRPDALSTQLRNRYMRLIESLHDNKGEVTSAWMITQTEKGETFRRPKDLERHMRPLLSESIVVQHVLLRQG